MSAIIQTNRLTKSYGRSRGIIDVTFDIQEGEVFGFLGPNGAGKTTTMRTLMGLLRANSGSATIGGLDCWTQSTAVKKLVGYLPGEFSFDPGLRGAQIIEYLGHLRGGVDQAYLRPRRDHPRGAAGQDRPCVLAQRYPPARGGAQFRWPGLCGLVQTGHGRGQGGAGSRRAYPATTSARPIDRDFEDRGRPPRD